MSNIKFEYIFSINAFIFWQSVGSGDEEQNDEPNSKRQKVAKDPPKSRKRGLAGKGVRK